MGSYDPATHQPLTFHDARAAFESGADTPSAYLERCIEAIEARDGVVQAFVSLNLDTARTAAQESTQR